MSVFTFVQTSPTAIPASGLVTSTISSSLVGTVTNVSIALNGLSHTFPDDLDMLLVGPNGTSNLMFMSDAGDGTDYVGANLVFSDAATQSLHVGSLNQSGYYLPTVFTAGENDATFGSATGGIHTPDAFTFASAFGGSSSSGNWVLRIFDDFPVDSGSLASWSITLTLSESAPTVQGTGAADSYSTFWTSATGGYYFLGSQMVAFSGVTALRFEGSGGADTINCGSGADIVADGGGGDNVNLGAGNDTLIFDNLLDGDVYNGGAGIDTFDWSGIVTSVDYTINLTAGNWSYLASSETVTGFENIKGADQTGVSKETLIGNALVNQIFGNGGNDIINGMAGADLLNGGAGGDFLVGGLGSDKMTGGAANDVFQYNSIGERGDIITDYSNVAGNNDTFRISAAGFGGGLVAGGVLAASQFQIRADNVAQDANDRFIFRTTDKTLWFDANGSAAGGLFMVADLQASATMSAADIVIF